MEDHQKVLAQKRRWYQRHKEEIKAKNMAHYHKVKDTPEYKRKVRATVRRWRAENRDRYNENARRWQKEDRKKKPTKYRHKSKLSRARNYGAIGSHTPEQWLARIEYYGWRCAYCRKPLTKETLTQDHRIALSKGGSHFASNVVPACQGCNTRKDPRKR